ncbi:MAG: restriction endonuclease subunit S, partial [Patescibacteria group bacterium]|nr:restriction endonuclease subunit S [Patescibacteria group bacterium]
RPENMDINKTEPIMTTIKKIKENNKNIVLKDPDKDHIDQSDLIELPTGWAWIRLGEICGIVEKDHSKENQENEFTYLDISSIDNKSQKIVSPKKYMWKDAPSRAKQIVRTGDILFSTVRTYLKNIAIVDKKYDKQIASTGFCVIRPLAPISNKYIFWLVQNEMFLDNLNQIQRGSNYPAVRDMDVFSQIVPLPPIKEQIIIGDELERAFTKSYQMEANIIQNISLMDKLNQGILKSAFQGNLVTQNSKYEDANILLKKIQKEKEEFTKNEEK